MNRTTPRRTTVVVTLLLTIFVAACGSDETETTSGDSIARDIRAAVAAVEADRGGAQLFFEITATPQLTNVFVAIDNGTAAVPYVYLDGELQPAGPIITGAAGQTFASDAIDFDESIVFSGVETDLPTGTIDAFSLEGGPGGFVRYVISVRSEQGGVLDIVVTPTGSIIEVNPL